MMQTVFGLLTNGSPLELVISSFDEMTILLPFLAKNSLFLTISTDLAFAGSFFMLKKDAKSERRSLGQNEPTRQT
mgnify:CR=1 FL=1